MSFSPRMSPRMSGAVSSGLGGGAATSEIPIVPDIGATFLALWDARAGIDLVSGAVDTWTDLVDDLVLTATGETARPAFAADGANFGALPVLQFDGINDALENLSISPALFNASRPHWFMVFRYRSVTAAQKEVFSARDGADSTSFPYLYRAADGAFNNLWYGLGGNPAQEDPSTTVHLWENWVTAAAGVISAAFDGGTVATSGTGANSGICARIRLGHAAGNFGPVSVAVLGVAAAELTTQQRADLRAHYQASWGAP